MNNNNPAHTPAMQPDREEQILFVYGYSLGTVQLSRVTAEKAAQQKIGQLIIFPGRCLRVIDVRLEDDPADNSKGRVIAICERVEQQNVPYHPPMEYK